MRLRHLAALLALCLALYLPGLTGIPATDRDEARFAQAAKQMVLSGDWIDIRFQAEPRHKKPAGAYWLQALSASLFSADRLNAIWAYRLPSLAGAVAAVLLTALIGARLFGGRAGLWAAALLAATALLVVEAHLAKADALLLAAVCAAQYPLARLYLARDPDHAGGGARLPLRLALLFWAALGAGILIKGPVILAVIGLTALALAAVERRWRWLGGLRPLPGLAVMLAIALPWLIMVEIRTGGGFTARAVGDDLLPKLLGGVESHGGWPGYHLALAPLTLWPVSLLLVPALVGAWRDRSAPAVRFLLAWLLPCWILFELVPTKLPHYVLPAVPALALLMAAILAGRERDEASRPPAAAAAFAAPWSRVWAGVWALLSIALGLVVSSYSMGMEADTVGSAVRDLAGIALMAAGVAGLLTVWRRRARQAAIAAIAGAMVCFGLLLGGLFPRLDDLFVARALLDRVATIEGAGPGAQLAATGFHEPSLVFAAAGPVDLTDPAGAAALLAATGTGIALVERAQRPAFLAAIERHGIAIASLGTVRGLNYSRGAWVEIELFRRRAGTGRTG